MKNRLFKSLLIAALLAYQPSAMAEDIDLFLGVPPGTEEAPNVLIILDNTGNWSAPFVNEKAALVSVINALPVDKLRVGLMMFTETGGGDSNVDGAYVRAAIRLMNSSNKTLYSNMINSFDSTQDRSNSGKAGKTMAEAYYYFAGLAPFAGNNKNKSDYTNNTYTPTTPPGLVTSMEASRPVWALSGNALPSKGGSPYISPVTEGCAKNFIIWISNGAAQDSNADTTAATTLLSTAGGNTTAIPISPSGSQSNVADEWARFMKANSLGVTTYTVDINKVTTGQGPGWTALLKSMAAVSDGKYFDVDSTTNAGQEISDALNQIFTEIQAINSVFASVSLPASVNAQSTFLNQVFIGMFRPDADAFPRWPGNLKQYKMGVVNGVLEMLDADSNIATNSNTNFITECARSFWTPSTTDTYWAFKDAFFTNQGSCLSVPGASSSNYPDGKFVEKGAQAYQLRSSTTRTVKTCSATFGSCTVLTDFNNTNVTQALLGADDSTEQNALINWARGIDLDDENLNGIKDGTGASPNNVAEMRPSAHGDVVHSRPVVINYGTNDSPQVVVFYGGNDGVLRAINGNRDDGTNPTPNIGSVTPGKELWAFIPPEFYPYIKRLRDNDTQISFPGNTTGSPLPKPYGIDGPISAFDGSIAGNPLKALYTSMRRGGRALYAFDVTAAASPTLKWKKGCPNAGNDTDCTTGFTGIGQTWSTPSIVTASGYAAGASPILMVGGGYDPCEDTDDGTVNHSCTASTKGNKIYVLDADTGTLLKTMDTDRSVTAGFTVVNNDSGNAQYAYTADTGGNIYRITMLTAAPADWTITKLASLGCDTAACAAGAPNRKFMMTPDVVKVGSTHHVLIGSGDREKPLVSYTATANLTNYFFMVKDIPTDSTWLTDENATCSADVICLDSLTPILTSADPTQTDLDAKKGWFLGLAASEQVVNAPLTISDVVSFSTHTPTVPAPGSCGNNLGIANAYNINFKNAASANNSLDGSRYVESVGGGLSPSPVAGKVILDDGTEETFCIGCNEEKFVPTPPVIPPTWTQPKSRVYWYIEQ